MLQRKPKPRPGLHAMVDDLHAFLKLPAAERSAILELHANEKKELNLRADGGSNVVDRGLARRTLSEPLIRLKAPRLLAQLKDDFGVCLVVLEPRSLPLVF